MQNRLSSDQQLVLDRLLSELAARVDGAVDFWTQICFLPAAVMADRLAFVTKNSDILSSLITQVTAVLAEPGLTDDERVRGLLDTLARACQKLEDAFQVLIRFQSVPVEQVASATESLAEGHARLLAAIQQLAGVVGCPIAYWRQRTPEREEYYQKILAGLLAQFREARASAPQVLARASGV